MWNVLSYFNLFQRFTSGFLNLVIDNLNWLHALLLPVGSMIVFPAGSLTNYLPCDGSLVNVSSFPALYSVIGTTFNTGGESGSQFRLPNVADPVANTNWFIRYQ